MTLESLMQSDKKFSDLAVEEQAKIRTEMDRSSDVSRARRLTTKDEATKLMMAISSGGLILAMNGGFSLSAQSKPLWVAVIPGFLFLLSVFCIAYTALQTLNIVRTVAFSRMERRTQLYENKISVAAAFAEPDLSGNDRTDDNLHFAFWFFAAGCVSAGVLIFYV